MISPEILSQPAVYWFFSGLALALIELALPGLIVVFFGAGAWTVALLCLIYPIGLNAELIIFIITSLIYVATLRKWLKKKIYKEAQEMPELLLEDYIGNTATVAEDISPDKLGAVMFHGTIWKAESAESIPAGKQVTISGKKNITLTVTTQKL